MDFSAISALIGAVAGGVVLIIKQIFSKNENKQLTYAHEERLIELIGQQNSSNQTLNNSIVELTKELSSLRKDLNSLNQRVQALENNKTSRAN